MKKKFFFSKAKDDVAESTSEAVQSEVTDAAEKKRFRLSWKNNRKLRLGTTATAFTVVVIAAVLVFNVIVSVLYNRFPLSFDLTSDNTYTLSDQARAVAKNVKDDITIDVFLSESYFKSPSFDTDEYNTILRQFYLFTKEYGSLSDGHVQITYYDLESNPTLATKFSDYDIEYGSILFRRGTQSRLFGVDNLYSYDYDSTYGYVYTSKVEEVLSSTVNSLCGGKTVTVTFLTGHGESSSLISHMSSLYQLNGYATQELNFKSASAEKIDETTEMLVIAAPTDDYTADEISRLREWLNNDGELGRNLFVLCNYDFTTENKTGRGNLYDFLADDYGITVTDKLIAETDANKYMSLPNGEFMPLTSMNTSDITDSDGVVFMPYTLQLKLSNSDDPSETGVGNVALVNFSNDAELVDVDTISSANQTKTKADTAPVGMAYATEANGMVENHVIVSGSYLFPLYSSTYAEYQNEELMLEPVRNTCTLGNTIAISSKSLATPTLSVTEKEALVIRIIFISLPVLLVITSLVIFFRRRHL